MSIFGDILHKIFFQPPTTTPPTPSQATTPEATPAESVNVSTILQGLAQHATEPLDWQHSIVDLMKLLGLDSSLAHRRALASELGYKGDMSDSAAMNIWLHEQVMKKLAEHQGSVPEELTGHTASK